MTAPGNLPFDARHIDAMALALTEAQRAADAGEVPVGAVMLNEAGEVIASTHNECRGEHPDVTAHAEVLAIRQAAAATARGTLEGCTLVVTLEPCAMCAGAILAARIPTVVFGAWDEKAGAAGSVHDLLRDRRLPHRCDVIAGVDEAASTKLLQAFFADRR